MSSFVAGCGIWVWSDQTPSLNTSLQFARVTVKAAGVADPVRSAFSAEPSPLMLSGNAKLSCHPNHR